MTVHGHANSYLTDQALLHLLAGTAPDPSFRHLLRMSDDVGLFEHARGPIPLREHGYCVDDVARGLIVVCREPDPDAELVFLAETYLAFLMHARGADGAFHNRLGFDRVWHDEPEVKEWWGRALWALGTAAAHGPTPGIREAALEYFESGAGLRSDIVRGMAFAALGAAEVQSVAPTHGPALALLADAAKMIGPPRSDPDWPWPEARLDYADGALPEVLIAAGHATGDQGLLADGLRLLGWLLDVQTRDGHLSLTPVGGRAPGETGPLFDQQPIEAASLADACARAYEITGDGRWLAAVHRAVDWFLGDNDANVPLVDPLTGGGCDGLQPEGRNENQGAESTLALISTLQHGRRLARLPGM